MPVTLFTPTFGTNWSPARPSWGRMQPSRSSTSKKKQPRNAKFFRRWCSKQNGQRIPRNPCFMKLSIGLHVWKLLHIWNYLFKGDEVLKIRGACQSRQAFFALELWKAKGHPLFLTIFCAAWQDKRAIVAVQQFFGPKIAVLLNLAKSIVHVGMIRIELCPQIRTINVCSQTKI